MNCKASKYNEWFIVSIEGKFVVKNLTLIRSVFNDAELSNEKDLAIDLSETTHLDSSALTLMINLNKRILKRNGRLVIIKPNKDISEVFEIVGFDKLIPIYETFELFREKYE